MTALAPSTVRTAPSVVPATDPADVRAVVDVVLLDLVHARRTVGQTVRVPELALASGRPCAAARLAVGRLADAGVLVRSPFSTDAVVAWQPGQNRLLLRRLSRLVAVAAGQAPDLEQLPEPPHGALVAEAAGLTVPFDAVRVLALCRSLFTVLPTPGLTADGLELLDLLEVLCSDEMTAAHDVQASVPARVRDEIVDRLELAAHLGDWVAVREIAQDYVEAATPESVAAASR